MYDVIIIGAGPAGLYCAYELIKKAPNLKVLMVDKGLSIYDRSCPILAGKVEQCPRNKKGYASCYPSCSITSGFGGSGTYSDGKFNITAEFGGWMTEYLPRETVLELIRYVDQINLAHGATPHLTNPYTPEVKAIERKAIAVGLKLLRSEVRHLGTDENIATMKSIYDFLAKHIDIKFKTFVSDVIVKGGVVRGVVLEDGTKLEAKYVMAASGREGSAWLEHICKQHGIAINNNQIDIGVRVETSNIVMEEINKYLYEGKFIYNASVGTVVRTFCSNPSGYVVMENHNGTILANGHAYNDPKMQTDRTNFALLVSHKFGEPFNNPNEYGHMIGRLANKLSCGRIIVQKYGDLKKGRRTTEKRLKEGFVQPTLVEAVPGDLGLALPYNTMISIIEMIEALDHVTPGLSSEHTLLYGVEAKFYSARPEVNDKFETKIKNLFVGGDGAGLTRGLAQAGANGVWVAREIAKRSKA